jgi:toluene monooxygenase system ferredoxin subunit
MSDWRAVIEIDEIWEGELVACQVDGIAVLFVNIDGDIHAFLDKCPHLGTPLNLGLLEGRVLTCASHHWRFDVVDGGAGVNPKNCRLTSFPVRMEDGKVLVQITMAEPKPA